MFDWLKRRIRKSEVWHLKKVSFADAMLCEMESEAFDKMTNKEKCTVPVIDGVAYTYLVTPAYPIIVRRKDKVGPDYGQ